MNEMQRKVLWAVDPASEDHGFQLQVARAMEKLVKDLPVKIEPVSVLPPDNLDSVRAEWEKTLSLWSHELAIPHLLPPVFLVQANYSLEAGVQALLEYAQLAHAEIIGVGTHSKKPLERFFMGSFAESLVATSSHPVFLISPHSQALKMDRILFPTDFSDKSFAVFESLLSMAHEKKSKVVLFHKVQLEAPPPIFGFDPVPVYEEFLVQDGEKKRRTAQIWAKRAEAAGVETEVVFHDQPGFPVDAILSGALQQGCGMIALASESGPTEAALLGSISRQVMRHAPCPVWVLHPQMRAAS